LCKFCSGLDWKMMKYFVAICNILRTFVIWYDHLVHFVLIWYIFFGLGIMYQEKSGSPDSWCTFFPNDCVSKWSLRAVKHLVSYRSWYVPIGVLHCDNFQEAVTHVCTHLASCRCICTDLKSLHPPFYSTTPLSHLGALEVFHFIQLPHFLSHRCLISIIVIDYHGCIFKSYVHNRSRIGLQVIGA
jgi:hypothetical protein